jgi:hypothetical protein
VDTVGGGEEKRSVDVTKGARVGAGAPRVDVRDPGGAGGGPIGTPQLKTGAIVGNEEQRSVDVGEGAYIGIRGAATNVGH